MRSCLAIALLCSLLPAQSVDPRQKLIDELDGIASKQLEARKQAVSQVRTRAEAERRRSEVRQKITALIGGLPESHGPVVVKDFGTISGDGFRIEKLAFQSIPDFWVTANVYVPAGPGPFPAMVLTPGHEATGKLGQYAFGVNFARMGILSLAFDPIGQGERLQYFNPDKKASEIGAATGEHGEANLPTLLIGDDLMRYMVHDAMRAIDYLSNRKDVDSTRIGALGCSGGGTATAALAALDDRIKAAGTACYITSFQELLPSATGVQEAEQSIPHFIEQSLDFADWLEAAAPRPYAIISTTADMFPFEGARQSYEEAKRIYALYGAEDRLHWITGPGGHGNLGPISPAILSFFARYLKDDASEQNFNPVRPANTNDLLCTSTGQVSTSLGGETVASLNRKRADAIIAARRPADKRQLATTIRDLIGPGFQGGPKLGMSSISKDTPQGYTVEIGSDSETIVPKGGGRKPAILWLEAQSKDKILEEGGDAASFVAAGNVVTALEARPWPPGTESIKSPYLGSFNLLSLRAFLVGRTILGIRVDDALDALSRLASRSDVDAAHITVYGKGPLGMVALHVAALDSRVSRVVVEDSLVSYRSIVDAPVHRNASEVVIPGVLRHYDVEDLLAAIAPRTAVVVNARDAAGAPANPDFHALKNVTVRLRGEGEKLPIE